MNFRSHDYKIIVLKNAILKHCFGTPYQVKSIFKRKDIKIHRYSPLRYYYICRNQTFVETRLARETKQAHKAIAHRLIVSLRVLAKILVYESDLTLLKAWACIRGTSDGLFGKLGKSW
jgi:rhamnosyltransferase